MIFELLLFGIIGLAVGSFLTVVVDRYDTAESLFIGRSHCNHCGETLRWWELLPIVSYLALRGRCIRCDKRIPHVYPLFELVTGLVFMGLRWAAPSPVHYGTLLFELVFVSLLLILSFYDWLHENFPVTLLHISVVAAVLVVIADHLWPALNHTVFVTDPLFHWLASPTQFWYSSLIGAVISGIFLGALAFPSRGRWMGYGDVYIAVILGLWLGYPLSFLGLLLAFYAGALVGLVIILAKKLKQDHHIPFGPFLVFGAIIAHIWGPSFMSLLIRLWGGIG